MQFTYKKVIGRNEFTFHGDAKTHIEFFQAVDFYSTLPEVGPNGEKDLILRFRQVGDFTYYSVVCPSAKKEFKFGQLKPPGCGLLFPKGWEPLFDSQDSKESSSSDGGGLGDDSPTPPKKNHDNDGGGLGGDAPSGPTPALGGEPEAKPKKTSPLKTEARAEVPAEVKSTANDVLAQFLKKTPTVKA